MATQSIRRSVALPKHLVDEVSSVAPPELRRNWNRLVRVALEEFSRSQREKRFAQAMAAMAADPAIRKECTAIEREFAPAESDGLSDD
jgi:metal-responsive CopG/Arc/MetJ family transcriptional regulator